MDKAGQRGTRWLDDCQVGQEFIAEMQNMNRALLFFCIINT